VHLRWIPALAAVTISGVAMVQAPRHLNPVVDLLAQKKAVFGLYAPANRRPGRGGAMPADAPAPKTPSELARDAATNSTADYLFDGTMEGDFDRAFSPFTEFMKGMSEAGMLRTAPAKQLYQPLFVKTHKIAPDPALANQRIANRSPSALPACARDGPPKRHHICGSSGGRRTIGSACG
jgi:hypothetical protein